MCTELGSDARILAVNSMFTKMGIMDFHDGSLSKEVSSGVPSCQNATHQRNREEMLKLCPLNWQILTSNVNIFYCQSHYLKNVFLNHSAANSPSLQGHFL